MVNGLPGKMATEVAKRIVASEDFYLWHYALTGPETKEDKVAIDKERISLYRPDQRVFFKVDSYFPEEGLVVDFSLPSAVNYNADYYCSHRMNFVMGTTGGDRIALEARVRESHICAAIAPNMAQPIVSLQAFMQDFAASHENQFKGYTLNVRESHQQGKPDTSGTARAFCKYFKMMGFDINMNVFEELKNKLKRKTDDVSLPLGPNSTFTAVRNLETQRKLGVPEEHLAGHGWHTYYIQAPNKDSMKPLDELKDLFYRQFFVGNPALRRYERELRGSFTQSISPDGNVLIITDYNEKGQFTLTHNINGRSVYVDGTLDALRFLRERKGERGKVYSMIDVLNAQEKAQTLSE